MSIGSYFHALSTLSKIFDYSFAGLGLILLIVSKFISVCYWFYILYWIIYLDGNTSNGNETLLSLLYKPAMGYDDKKVSEDSVDMISNDIELDEVNTPTKAGFSLYLTWAFLSILDVTLLKYLPWTNSDANSNADNRWRSILKGYPSLLLAKTCTYGFLWMQSVQSLSSIFILIGNTWFMILWDRYIDIYI